MIYPQSNPNPSSHTLYSERDLQLLDILVRLMELDPTPEQLDQALARIRKMVHRIQDPGPEDSE